MFTRRVSLILVVVLAGAVVSCGDDDGNGPSNVPDATGTYSVTFTWIPVEEPPESGCLGTLEIFNQTDGNFSGNYSATIDPPGELTCFGGYSGTFTGTIDDRSVIRFFDIFEETMSLEPGCNLISGSDVLGGSLTNNQLSVQATATWDCTGIPWRLEIEGMRTG